MAKDILRLHGIIWPAMLLAAGLRGAAAGCSCTATSPPAGEKMSKTLGNVIDPFEVIDMLGADALRYYLMREVQWGQDGDVTWEGLHRRYEGELANDLGNLVSRSHRHDRPLPRRPRAGGPKRARARCTSRWPSGWTPVDLSGALGGDLGRWCDRPTASSRSSSPGCSPRATTPEQVRALDETLYTLADTVRSLGVLLYPYIPAAAGEDPGRPSATPAASSWERAGLGAARGRHRGAPARAAVPARRAVIDTHAHLERCAGPADAAVAEAAAAGVDRILTIGREQAVDLADRHRRRVGRSSAGTRTRPSGGRRRGPAAAASPIRGWWRWARSASTSTVTTPRRDDQRRVFAAQIELANELGLPLVIHTRDADHETFPMLERARVPVVLHCFSSPQRLR